MSFRDRTHGLLLSELGGYMDGLGQGGGTKRLSTFIHHHGWKAKQIETFLLRRADEQIAQWEARGEEGLLIWDATVLEKPESLKAQGLCAVRSSKALRLTRIKKGYYHPPASPSLSQGCMGLVCSWLADRISKGRRGFRDCAGGRRVAPWPVTRRMKTVSSCDWSRSAGEAPSSMYLIEAIVAVHGWEPFAASRRVLSCGGRPTLIW